MNQTSDLDWQVRRHVYDVTLQRGYPPTIAEIASALSLQVEHTQAALQRLAAGRALVLRPGTGEIIMANPFSAVPTPFLVELSSFSCFGNCIWDALGIPAMLKQDARIKTACSDCGMALEVSVIRKQVQGDPSVVHFAVPAHHWWDDIVFN
jgi:hypothetical protein